VKPSTIVAIIALAIGLAVSGWVYVPDAWRDAKQGRVADHVTLSQCLDGDWHADPYRPPPTPNPFNPLDFQPYTHDLGRCIVDSQTAGLSRPPRVDEMGLLIGVALVAYLALTALIVARRQLDLPRT
jgi:hypothetical protein